MISRVFSQSFQVFVKTCTGKTITIDVEGSETIESVKEKINAKDGTPVERQRVIYAGKLLRNDLTVDDFDIKRECNIQMLIFSQSFQVFVKTCTGKTITIDVDRSETIESVKEKINAKDGTPVQRQKLRYAGKFLRNDLTVDDFDIKRECTIQMLSPLPPSECVLPKVRKCVCMIAELIKA
ncbi:hypothetical protein CAPTEDRAFT_147724 [Capitella teleta]|uniref:Ubiquitin-like domain-containing protein n=2 Tax=Capitella teleta TaxID=283909 RepID=R7TVC4_CAPTE|nr:hypothetical protein CAPTEDRAFT_147724 [Capitella teleta]|eukprot:ELT97674.1 hypothetical protein CAPTEDRAFT_147724 [Capitella teleta]